MNGIESLNILFVAGFGPIGQDNAASRELYGEVLGIPFKEEENGYLHTEELPGVKVFAMWPLSQAAESCFDTDQWPDDVPILQAWLELMWKMLKRQQRAWKQKATASCLSPEEPWARR